MLSQLYRPLASATKSCVVRISCRSASVAQANIGNQSEIYFEREKKYGAHNYAPMGVAINKGEGGRYF